MRALAFGGALSLALMMPGAASAAEGFSGSGSGSATVTFDGDGTMADIEIDWQGLAAEIPDLSGTEYEALSGMTFPHAQHIHAGADAGECPTPAADADGDGIINTPEGQPAYGGIVTSLTTGDADTSPDAALAVADFPAGESATYSRTIDLGDEAAGFVRDGKAAIVVHGIDPAVMPGDTALADSAISEDLPLAATAPVLCGVLTDNGDGTFTAQLTSSNPIEAAGETQDAAAEDSEDQMNETPNDGVATGGGSTADTGLPVGLLSVAGLLALAAAGVAVASRRSTV